MRTRIAVVVPAVVGLVTACTGGPGGDRSGPTGNGGDGIDNPRPDIMLAAALTPFDACEDLRSYLTEHAAKTVGPWGFDLPVSADVHAAARFTETAAGPGPVVGTDYSGTNVQETGVDEPDSVKTDGEYLYTLGSTGPSIVDVSGAGPTLVSATGLGQWAEQLLLSGDRLLVLGQARVVHPVDGVNKTIGPEAPNSRMELYDVGDPADPRLVSTLRVDGYVLSARLVDGIVRVVLRTEPYGLPFGTPKGSGRRAEREAIERNRETIGELTVEDWLPHYRHQPASGPPDTGVLPSCEQVHRPSEFSGTGTTSVFSLDPAADLVPKGSVGVLAGGQTVYASPDRLYVAANRWFDWRRLPDADVDGALEDYTTELHAFDIADPAGARYLGSGSVRGSLLSQWSMSEHDGVLRVATTDGFPGVGRSDRSASECFVTTFAERAGGLAQVGQLGGLGKDE